MSEYQYIAFRAIDAPVSKTNLEFMRKQSSRAEITPWSFDNEYHFGDFHGNAQEMLRRGYDFHFHYANFGYRTLMIRLPNGLPDEKAAKRYFERDSLHFVKDKSGPGGILRIEPAYESGHLDDVFDQEDMLDRLLPLRGEIMEGDLRPLYLAHLAVSSDMNHDPDEQRDAPVPAGLDELTDAQEALAELFGLSDGLIAAAAEGAPAIVERAKSGRDYATWVDSQPLATKNAWLSQLMADSESSVRSEMLAEFQKSRMAPSWPTSPMEQTVGDLLKAGEEIEAEANRKKAKAASRRRAEKLTQMAVDPMPTLLETEELVRQKSTQSYEKAAQLLADLHKATAGNSNAYLAEQQAHKLRGQNPTRKLLVKVLREKGFLKK